MTSITGGVYVPTFEEEPTGLARGRALMVDDPEIEPLEGGDDDVEEEPAEIDGDTDGDAVPTERPDPSPKSDPVPLPDEPVPTETPGQP